MNKGNRTGPIKLDQEQRSSITFVCKFCWTYLCKYFASFICVQANNIYILQLNTGNRTGPIELDQEQRSSIAFVCKFFWTYLCKYFVSFICAQANNIYICTWLQAIARGRSNWTKNREVRLRLLANFVGHICVIICFVYLCTSK